MNENELHGRTTVQSDE